MNDSNKGSNGPAGSGKLHSERTTNRVVTPFLFCSKKKTTYSWLNSRTCVSVGGQEKHAEAQALHREAVLASLFAASALSGLRQVVFVRIDVSLPGL